MIEFMFLRLGYFYPSGYPSYLVRRTRTYEDHPRERCSFPRFRVVGRIRSPSSPAPFFDSLRLLALVGIYLDNCPSSGALQPFAPLCPDPFWRFRDQQNARAGQP
eukprot:6214010-Pleurochrysis_carterae.AAC.6